jgi:hypothetical protein
MLRTLGVVAALQVLAWTPAWACSGQVGTSIYQDNFSDDSGGWDESPPMAMVKPPVFVFAMDATTKGFNVLNTTFNATDGDYCMDFVLPAAIAANNQMYAGIVFWATPDYSNMMQLQVGSDASVYLAKSTANVWTTIFAVKNAPGFKSGANAVNTLRVTALSGLITVYLNGSTVKAVRAQEPPSANASFGMNGFDDTAAANAPQIQVKDFSVTAGK